MLNAERISILSKTQIFLQDTSLLPPDSWLKVSLHCLKTKCFSPPLPRLPPASTLLSQRQAFAHAGRRFVLPPEASQASDVLGASILPLQAVTFLSSIVPREQLAGHAACLEVAGVIGRTIAQPGRVRVVFVPRQANVPASNRRVQEAFAGNRGVVSERTVSVAVPLVDARVREALAGNRRVIAIWAVDVAVSLLKAWARVALAAGSRSFSEFTKDFADW